MSAREHADGSGRRTTEHAGALSRRSTGVLLLAGAILVEVVGSLSLKGALEAPWLYAVVAVGYVSAFGLLALVLRTGMPLGVAYGIWGACGVALTAILSVLLFDESLTPLMGAGIIVVIAGVLCVELGSQAGQRAKGQRAKGQSRGMGRSNELGGSNGRGGTNGSPENGPLA